MRITHLIASLDPAAGGPPVVAERLAKAQASLGHAVTLAAEVLPADPPPGAVALPHHGLTALWAAPAPALADLVARTDVMHIHGVWEPLLLAAGRAARSRGIPYIVAPHGMLDPWSLRQKSLKKRLALRLGARRFLNHAAALHTLNEDEKRLLAPLGLTCPIAVIPNGIFLDDVEPPPDPALFRNHPGGPGDKPYLLFLSRLHYKKGLDFLADAFAAVAKEFPKFVLVVAGPDGGEEKPFRDRIAGLGLSDRVLLPGPLYGPLKWSAIAGASCFVLPSRQEGFSVAILEALACRVPVVVSDACHFPEVAEVSAGEIVPLAAPAIGAAIARFLADSDARRRAGAAGRRLVEERFTWPQVARRSVELYERLVRPASAG